MRNLRIRQLLLLMLRTAIILCLVIAFARPTLRNGAGSLLAERSPIEAVIILDNSLSLNEARLTGSLLENLRQAFIALEPVFQNSDRITIMQASQPQDFFVRQESYQSGMWERVLQKLQPNYLKSNLDNALISALSIADQSVYASREIYVLSDFQYSALQENSLTESITTAGNDRAKIFTIPIMHGSQENISVDSVAVVNQLIETNQPLQIKAFIRNHHPDKYLNTLTSVMLNGKRVSQQKVSLAPGQLSEVRYQLTLTESGFIQGRIETESDIIQEDNRRYFNFYVPERIKVLHIYPDADYQSFLPLVIQPAIQRDVFEYEGETLVNWTARNFNEFDMIVLEGLEQIPEALVNRLSFFVEQGGGTFVIPGESITIPQYRTLFSTFQLGSILTMQGTPGSTNSFLTLDNFMWDHPVFEGLFEDNQRKLNPIEVYASYRVKTQPTSDVLISLSDRSPLLLHNQTGKGTAFFLTTGLSPEWSQLPLKGFIVPLIYRSIYYAGTQKVLDRQQIRTGEIYQQQFTNLEAPYDFQMEGDNAVAVKLNPRFKGADVFLEFRESSLPGNYLLRHNNKTLSVVSVNSWPEESEMAFYTSEGLLSFLPDAYYFNDPATIAEQVQQSRFGQELWRHFLIAAFILLLIEMIVARTGNKDATAEDSGDGNVAFSN